MKMTVAVGLLTVFTICYAGTQKGGANDVLLAPTGLSKAGDSIDIDSVIYTLYINKKCPLPIVNAEHMRLFESRVEGAKTSGCWGMLLGDSVLLIDPDGTQNQMARAVFGRATLQPDGTAKLQYPSYGQYHP
ncbi:hypothetical protein [Burkholderia gladioli]|uniref:hypothetical protein n=1 Tax=Burkholderia gladioli TaxID=28095 RepID=UPI001641AE73|nr:hypothetical protein [Burkholderia gladioli]